MGQTYKAFTYGSVKTTKKSLKKGKSTTDDIISRMPYLVAYSSDYMNMKEYFEDFNDAEKRYGELAVGDQDCWYVKLMKIESTEGETPAEITVYKWLSKK